MFTLNDFLLFGVVIAVPLICSLTMGRNGTYTERMKGLTTFGISLVATAYYMYSINKDLPSAIIETIVGCVLFGGIGSIIITYFDNIWNEQEATKRRLEREEERNRELRKELREREED